MKLTAVPDFDWVFLRREGDVPEGEEEMTPISVVMDGPKEIKAFFVETICVSVSVEMFRDFPQAYEQLVGAPSPEGPARLPLADPAEEWRESARQNEFIVMLDRVLSRQEQASSLEAAGYSGLEPIACLGAHLVVPLETELIALSGEEHLEVFRQLNGFVAAHLYYDFSLQAIISPIDPFYAQ